MANNSNIPFNPQNRPPQKNAKADEWFEKMLENQRKARTIGVPQLRQPNEMNPVPLGQNPDAGTSAGQTTPAPKKSPTPANTNEKPPAPGKARTETAFAQSAKNLRDMQYIRELLPIAAQSAQGKQIDNARSAKLYQGMAQLGLNTGAPAYETLLRRRKEIEQSLAARQSTAKDATPAQIEHAASPVTFAQVLKSLEDTALIRDLLPHAAQKIGGLLQDSGVLSKLKEGLSYLGIDDNDSAYDALNRRNAEAKQNRAAYQTQASNTGAAQAPSPANMARIFEGLQDIQFMRSLLPIAARQAQGGNISREQAARLSHGLSQLGLKVQGTAYDALIRRIKEIDQEMDGYENPAVPTHIKNNTGRVAKLDTGNMIASVAGMPYRGKGFTDSRANSAEWQVINEEESPVEVPPVEVPVTLGSLQNHSDGLSKRVDAHWTIEGPDVLDTAASEGNKNSGQGVPLDFFLPSVMQMYREKWKYAIGGVRRHGNTGTADCNSGNNYIAIMYGAAKKGGTADTVSGTLRHMTEDDTTPYLLDRSGGGISIDFERIMERKGTSTQQYNEKKKLYNYQRMIYSMGGVLTAEDIAMLRPGDIAISVTYMEKTDEYKLHMFLYTGPAEYHKNARNGADIEYTPHAVFHMPGEGKKATILPIEETRAIFIVRNAYVDYSNYMDYLDPDDVQIIREVEQKKRESQP